MNRDLLLLALEAHDPLRLAAKAPVEVVARGLADQDAARRELEVVGHPVRALEALRRDDDIAHHRVLEALGA